MRDSRFSRPLLSLLWALLAAAPLSAGTPPGEILLFADGFESGDTAAWPGIGAGGGRIVADGGRVILDFPPGAVEIPQPITVTPLSPPPHPDLVDGSVYEFGPDGSEFLLPVRLEIEYDPAAVPGPEDELAGAVLESSGDRARHRSAPVDVAAHRVVSQIEGFSVRGVASCNGPCFGPPELATIYNANRTITLNWGFPPVSGLSWQLERAKIVAGDPCLLGSSPFCVDDGMGNGILNGLQPPRPSEWTLRGANGATIRTFTDSVGAGGGVFWYRIRWRVGNGTTTSWSNTPRVLVFGLQPPPPVPTDVRVRPLPCGGIYVTWRGVFEASGYTIWRAAPGQPAGQIATVGGTEFAYLDASGALAPGENYRYWVRSLNTSGQSGFSGVANADNADSEFTIGLPAILLAVPPGGSFPLDVVLFRRDDPNLNIELTSAFDLPGFTASFSANPTMGGSVATISVDAAASPGLLGNGIITGTSLPPGSGASCSIRFQVRAREPGCNLQIPDVGIPPFVTSLADVAVDRWGFAGPVDLIEDPALPGQGIFTFFTPDPAVNQSTMSIIYKGGPQPPPFVTSGTVQAMAMDGSGVTCERQFEISVLAP